VKNHVIPSGARKLLDLAAIAGQRLTTKDKRPK